MAHKWLILTALAMEERAIAQACNLAASSAIIQIIGIGAKHASAEMCQGITVGVILAGFAGALEPSLKIGQIVVDYPENGPWHDLPWTRGKIHGAEKMISDPAQKAEAFRQTGALAVDMESRSVGRICEEAKLPLLTIRAISDTAQDSVSPKLLRWIDDFGNPKPLALAGGLASNPHLLPQVIQLARRTRVAGRNLGEAVGKLLMISRI